MRISIARVIKARMREDAVTITFKRIGKFFNKIENGGFSFPAMICRYTSARNKAIPIRAAHR